MAFGSSAPVPPPNRFRTGCLGFAGLSVVLLTYTIGYSAWDRLARSTARSEAYDVLALQKNAWNEGDLGKFLSTYRMHDDVTFYSEGRLYKGWDEINGRYRRMYADRSMGELTYEMDAVEVLNTDAVLLRGKWVLKSQGGTREGLYTILVRKFAAPEGWKVVHDHMTIGEIR